jgi:Leucine-rich repeat (LRR) protein
MLMNCVKKIPNEISDLKNLQFLSLPNNSKLTELPSNILKLKKLKFITLKGSSVKPSSELLEVFNEMGTNTSFFTKKSN